ncbi:MAG: hypothetical protein CMJ18_01955 [Phycisphaeraceae bacterium]|nr:hypothetical protein [Phycisphaeraceae bacterium]
MTSDAPSDPNSKDRVIADSGWGIKPDDQPANADDTDSASRRFVYEPGIEGVIKAILKAQRQRFNAANSVRIEPGRTTILDINGDAFTVEGLSYGDPNLIELLKALGASFNPRQVRKLGPDYKETREYDLSRAWAWGAERTG